MPLVGIILWAWRRWAQEDTISIIDARKAKVMKKVTYRACEVNEMAWGADDIVLFSEWQARAPAARGPDAAVAQPLHNAGAPRMTGWWT
jgi:hypothetical protein